MTFLIQTQDVTVVAEGGSTTFHCLVEQKSHVTKKDQEAIGYVWFTLSSLTSNILGPLLTVDEVQDSRRDCSEHGLQPSFSTAC